MTTNTALNDAVKKIIESIAEKEFDIENPHGGEWDNLTLDAKSDYLARVQRISQSVFEQLAIATDDEQLLKAVFEELGRMFGSVKITAFMPEVRA